MLIFLGLYLVFLLGVMPMLADPGSNVPPIDLAFHYTVDEVYGWIGAYGEAGRHRYMIGELTLDVAYPLVYTCLFIGLIGYLIDFQKLIQRSTGERKRSLAWLVILPPFIWLFDMLENVGIVTMLVNFPEVLVPIAKLTAWATSIKWSLAYFVIVLTLLLGTRRFVVVLSSK